MRVMVGMQRKIVLDIWGGNIKNIDYNNQRERVVDILSVILGIQTTRNRGEQWWKDREQIYAYRLKEERKKYWWTY